MTPLKAIRLKCLDCCCGQIVGVKNCPCTDCPLYIYRDGHNPARKGLGGVFGQSNTDTLPEDETE